MAKAWRSTTTIKAGTAGTFLRGDIVTGLSKENMRQLWEAGALEEATVEDPAPAAATDGTDVSGGSASSADGTKEE